MTLEWRNFILNEEIQFDHLSLMVKIKKDELINTLLLEGFKRVKFENRKPSQIGNGFAKMLFKPWEIHVRLLDLQQQGLGARMQDDACSGDVAPAEDAG